MCFRNLKWQEISGDLSLYASHKVIHYTDIFYLANGIHKAKIK